MILAVFIVAVTLGAEPELKVNAVIFRSAADGTFVLGNAPCGRIKPLGRFSVLLRLLPCKYRGRSALIFSG